jgi:hypothetical protein
MSAAQQFTFNFSIEKAEPGWINRLMNPRAEAEAYQQLKFALHRKLLSRVNLEAVLALPEERMRAEIRGALARLLEEEDVALNAIEQHRILGEVLDEVFGLGPLEPLLQDPEVSDILVTHLPWFMSSAAASCSEHRWNSKITRTWCASSKKSSAGWAGGSMNPRPWWTRGCPTVPV